MKQVNKAKRAKIIKDLTSNGNNKRMLYKIEKVIQDKETLELFNALVASIEGA